MLGSPGRAPVGTALRPERTRHANAPHGCPRGFDGRSPGSRNGIELRAARLETARATATLARLAFLVAAYKDARKKYPDALSDLMPEFCESVPLDPFTDKPFFYRKEGEGCILYSAGPNMLDDGGKTEEAGADDIVARFQ